MVEWSSSSFENYELSTTVVYVSCSGSGGTADGTFRLALNTNESDFTAVQGRYVSKEIGANAPAWEMLTSLENMPNIGTVTVEKTANVPAWEITFTSALGPFPALEVRNSNQIGVIYSMLKAYAADVKGFVP